ncbi:hypothetical protein HDU98_004691, partial [Podochytrium sp. JEL0797]
METVANQKRLIHELNESRNVTVLRRECADNLAKDGIIAGLNAENAALCEETVAGYGHAGTIAGFAEHGCRNLDLRNRNKELEERLVEAVANLPAVVFSPPPAAAPSPDIIAELAEEGLLGTPTAMADKFPAIGEKMRQ